MLFFRNDYGQGCIPEIMEYMNTTNGHSFTGYGMDVICQNAKETIKKHIPDYDVDIHFLVGGTITNQTIIKACLKPFEAVIACDTGHIATHETGAIEAVGHKVIPVTIMQERSILAIFVKYLMHICFHMNTWFIQKWFIFPMPQNMEQCIH